MQSGTAIKFGLAFCEASEGSATMPGRRVRFDGNEEELIELAKINAMAIGAGHSFIVFIDNAVSGGGAARAHAHSAGMWSCPRQGYCGRVSWAGRERWLQLPKTPARNPPCSSQ